ncbi:MAG: Ig-like domain-containing protein [Propionibacteriaceae bacterium]|nr:Ig-like domain-containing protein [Propionibacteriaceae bacterium]
MRILKKAGKSLTIVVVACIVAVTTAVPSFAAPWGYESTQKNANGSLNFSGWTNRGLPASETALGSLSFKRNGIDYKLTGNVPYKRVPGGGQALLGANIIHDSASGWDWFYTYSYGLSATSGLWYTNGAGTAQWLLVTPTAFYTKSQQGNTAIAVAGSAWVSNVLMTYSEVLDFTMDGFMTHTITLTNPSSSTISNTGFQVLIDTELVGWDYVPIVVQNRNTVLIESDPFRLYLEKLEANQLLAGDFKTANFASRPMVPQNWVVLDRQRPGSVLKENVDTAIMYNVNQSNIGPGQSVTISFRERLVGPHEYSSVNVRYVDDDNNGAVLTPKAGTQTHFEGVAGDPVGFTEADARAGVPDGYEYVSMTGATTFPLGSVGILTVHVAQPRMNLTASVSPASVSSAGSSVTYTFSVSNPSSVAVSGLTVTAPGSAPTATNPGFSGTGTRPSVTCNSTSLPAGGSTTCQASYALTQADIDAGQVNLTAMASATRAGSSGQIGSNPASATVTVSRNASLSLTANDPGTMTATGDKVTFSFTVKNTGNTSVGGLTINRVAFTGTGTNPTVTCSPTSLAPNASATCTGTYTVTQADIAAKEITVTATSSGTAASATVTSNQVTSTVRFVPGGPDLSVSWLDVDRTSQTVGKPVVATATIVDSYSNPVPGVTVTLGLDGSATFGAVTASRVDTTTCITNATGKCSVALTDKKAEVIHVTAVLMGSGEAKPIVGSGVAVTFTAGEPDPDPDCEDGLVGSNLSVDKSALSVSETSYATALITDAFCNPVPGVPVTFTLDAGSSALLTVTQATTDASGKAFASVTDNSAETVKLHARITQGEIHNSPVSITFSIGEFSYTRSTFTVVPQADLTDRSTWVAASTGSAYYTGILTAKDDYDNPILGLTLSDIVFTASSTDVAVTAVKDNNDGTYTVQYSSKVASATPTAKVTYQATAVGTPKPIPFKAGGPVIDPDCEDGLIGTNLSADPTSLQVGGTSKIIALVTDEFCNPVPDVPVDFTLMPGTSGVLTVTQATTNDAGLALADLRDDVAETVKVQGKISIGELRGSPVSVTFLSGDLSSVSSTFEVFITDPAASVVVADGVQSWTGRLVAKDAQGNLLTNLAASDMAFTGVPAGVTVSSVKNLGNGQYEVTYTSTVARSYTVALTYKGAQVGANKTITFVSGSVDARYSTVSVSPTEETVGLPVTVTVTAKDAHDNPVTGLTSTDIVIQGKSAGLPDLSVWGFAVSSDDGVYTYQATSKLVGDFEITATVTGVVLIQHPHVKFKPGGVCVNNCDPVDPRNVTRFEMVDNDQLADGVAKDSAKAYAYDTYGNAVPGAEVIVTDMSTGVVAGYLKPPSQTVSTGADGTAMVYWTSTKADTFTARGSIGGSYPPATNVMNDIRFSTGAADPSKSEMVITPTSPIVVGSAYTATVTIRDSHLNPVKNQAVAFSLTPATPAQLSESFCNTDAEGVCSVTISSRLVTEVSVRATVTKGGVPTDVGGNGDPAKASPQTVAFVAGSVCVENCDPIDPANITRVEVIVDGVEANGKASDMARAYAYDRFGNPVAGTRVESTTSDSALSIVAPIPATDISGQTIIEYRSLVAGAHVAKVTIDGKIPVTAVSMNGSTKDGSITVNFGSGAADPAHSTLTIDPTTPQVVGSDFVVTAHLKDVNDNAVSGAVVSFPTVTNLEFSENSCTSDGSGTCAVTVSSKIAGTYTISGRLGAVPVSNTVQARFTHGEVCVVNCDPVVPGNTTRVVVTVDGQEANGTARDSVTVYAYDYYGNAVVGAVVASAPVAGETNLAVQPAITPIGADATTTIWYTSTVRGAHKADVSVDSKTPAGSPVTLNYGSGAGSTATSSWVITPAGPLTVGEGPASTYTATATIKDATGNPVEDAVVVFTIDPLGPVFTPVSSCVTDNDGLCSVKVHSTRSGTYAVSAAIVAGPLTLAGTTQTAASIVWKADDVCSQAEGCQPVDPNLPAELRTRVEILANNQIADGVARDRVIVWAFDKWGNPVEGALVVSTSTSPALNIQTGIAAISREGSSTIWYTSTVAGDYVAAILVDGVRPVNAPVTLTFVSGPVCVVEDGCEPEGPGTDPARQTQVKVTTDYQPVDGKPDVVTGYAFDKFGNSVKNVTFDFVKSVSTDDLVIAPTCVTGNNGQCTANATAWVAGAHKAKASVGGTELINHGSPVTLNFVTGGVCVIEDDCVPVGPGTDPKNQTRVEITVNNQPVGTGRDEFKVFAFDKFGNSLKDVEFVITTDDTTLHLGDTSYHASVSLVTGAPGTATMKAHSNQRGSHIARVLVTGVELTQHGSPMNLRFMSRPVITSPGDGDLINDSTPTVSGTGDESGNTVTVTDKDGKELCTATVAEDLNWTCTVKTPLGDGDHTLVATEKDGAGNKSDPSAPVHITVDTQPPSDPIVDKSNGSQFTGNTDPDSKVTVFDGDDNPVDGCINVAPHDADGNFVCYPTVLVTEDDEAYVVAKDPAGNVSNRVPVVIDPIWAEVTYPQRSVGQDQIVTGHNFNPGESVCLVMNSDPVDLGCDEADNDGNVTITFIIPKDMPIGIHTLVLTGQRSGSASVDFMVTMVAGPDIVVKAPTGGNSQGSNSAPLWALACGLLLATLGIHASRRARGSNLSL